MKNYTLVYLDKQGNELQRKEITAENIKAANVQKKAAFANSKLNDLHKIMIAK